MGSKKSKKQMPYKAGGLKKIYEGLSEATKNKSFIAGIFTTMLKERGEEAEVVEISSLSKGQWIEGFLQEWLKPLMEYIDVIDANTPSRKAALSRVITFHKASDASPWSYGRLFPVDTFITLDFRNLQDRMQETISNVKVPSLAVWLKMDESGTGLHTLIIRADDENEVVVVAYVNGCGQTQTIAGKRQVALIGEMMYGDQHLSAIEPWVNYIDSMVDRFKQDELEELGLLFKRWGLTEQIDEEKWADLTRIFYTNEKFLEFVMGAGMVHAKPYLKQVHGLALGHLALQARKQDEIDQIRSEHEKEREKDRKRVLKSIERSELQAKGSQDLAQRTLKENGDLRGRVAKLERFGGSTDDAIERLHKSFAALFQPVTESLCLIN